MNARFDWVLFDAGGTLLGTDTGQERWYEQFFVNACLDQGITVTPAQVAAALEVAGRTRPPGPRFTTPERVRTFWEHTYSTCFGALIPGVDAATLAGHYIDRFEAGEFVELFPDSLETLDLVRASELRAGIVSNFGLYLGSFLRTLGIADYFELVLISAEEGLEKPDQQIFETAIARTGSPPERIMFVGDHLLEDYEASGQAGMFPVLVDRADAHRDRPRTRRVRRLDQIGRFLDGEGRR
ncbi:MAG: HAD-IA family hydrolase [Candidatus Riflebacteria bacterium]|nr:HAD-IA family hydrolase [Candidatus Riflebacteria bacterium]